MTTLNATNTTFVPAPPEGNYQGGDVWFTFLVPGVLNQNSVRVTVSSGTTGVAMTDGAIAAYLYNGGSYSSLSSYSFLGMADAGNVNMPILALQCLPLGARIFLRVWSNGNVNGNTFKLCLMRPNNGPTPVPNYPPNDDPCNAYPLTVGAVGVCTNTTQPPSATPFSAGPRNFYACATSPMADPSCRQGTPVSENIYRGGDVWYKVAIPANGAVTIRLAMIITITNPTNMGMALYTIGGTCGQYNTYNEIACYSQSGGTIVAPLKCMQPGSTVYIRCYSYKNEKQGYWNLCAEGTSDPIPLTNDNPCGAYDITNTCLNTATETNQNACFTVGFADPTCTSAATFTNGSTKDVWYKFTAGPSGAAVVDVNGGTTFKPGLAVYQTPSNLCADAMGQIACNLGYSAGNNNASVVLPNLTPGATYWCRVWGTAADPATPALGGTATNATPFTICMTDPAALPAGRCYYSLQMIDVATAASGNRGWGPGAAACAAGCASPPASGTSYVAVNVNGTITYYSNPDESTYALFQVPTAGPTLTTTYFPNWNSIAGQSYRLSVVGGGQVHPFPSGTATSTYTAINFCTVPPQLQQDCIGAYTICSNQPLTTSLPPGTGNVVDLNNLNRGCLNQEYGSGLWYFFRPRKLPFPGADVNGTIQMTIPSPDGGDYDWAIWRVTPGSRGQASTVCPPTTAPFRCSWAATAGDDTGMRSDAAEASEGAGGDGFVAPINHTAGVDEMFIMYVNRYNTSTNMNVTLTWNDPAGLLDCSEVLPVSLIDLAAELAGQGVNVTWSTASELNSSYFIVERSFDNENFSPIGEVSAMGMSNEQVDYLFHDASPKQGANYYRLQQVDRDGATTPTWSVVALVGQDASVPVLFPNPVKDNLFAAMELMADGPVVMKVMDALGRMVSTRTETATRGLRTFSYDMSGLAPGSYTFQATNKEGLVLGMARFMKE